MSALLLDGKNLASIQKIDIKNEVDELINKGINPTLQLFLLEVILPLRPMFE